MCNITLGTACFASSTSLSGLAGSMFAFQSTKAQIQLWPNTPAIRWQGMNCSNKVFCEKWMWCVEVLAHVKAPSGVQKLSTDQLLWHRSWSVISQLRHKVLFSSNSNIFDALALDGSGEKGGAYVTARKQSPFPDCDTSICWWMRTVTSHVSSICSWCMFLTTFQELLSLWFLAFPALLPHVCNSSLVSGSLCLYKTICLSVCPNLSR